MVPLKNAGLEVLVGSSERGVVVPCCAQRVLQSIDLNQDCQRSGLPLPNSIGYPIVARYMRGGSQQREIEVPTAKKSGVAVVWDAVGPRLGLNHAAETSRRCGPKTGDFSCARRTPAAAAAVRRRRT